MDWTLNPYGGSSGMLGSIIPMLMQQHAMAARRPMNLTPPAPQSQDGNGDDSNGGGAQRGEAGGGDSGASGNGGLLNQLLGMKAGGPGLLNQLFKMGGAGGSSIGAPMSLAPPFSGGPGPTQLTGMW